MYTIYIAEDGTPFKNELECKDYEWKLSHSFLKTIVFYDKNDNLLTDIFNEKTYCECMKVFVPNEEALKDFYDFVNYTGFCSFEDVKEAGVLYSWNEKEQHFTKS